MFRVLYHAFSKISSKWPFGTCTAICWQAKKMLLTSPFTLNRIQSARKQMRSFNSAQLKKKVAPSLKWYPFSQWGRHSSKKKANKMCSTALTVLTDVPKWLPPLATSIRRHWQPDCASSLMLVLYTLVSRKNSMKSIICVLYELCRVTTITLVFHCRLLFYQEIMPSVTQNVFWTARHHLLRMFLSCASVSVCAPHAWLLLPFQSSSASKHTLLPMPAFVAPMSAAGSRTRVLWKQYSILTALYFSSTLCFLLISLQQYFIKRPEGKKSKILQKVPCPAWQGSWAV